MATPVTVLVAVISNVRNHPNADKLMLADVNGWQIVIPKGIYAEGDKIVYFPPDTILPATWADAFGVRQYLKGSEKNRVGKIQLRGEPSFGLPVKLPAGQDWEIGTNVAEFFGATKFEIPMKPTVGEAETPHPMFTKYTDIENLRNYPTVFIEGEEVVCTEKIHGTNSRVGLVEGVKMAGSMELRRKWPSELVKRQIIDPDVVTKLGQANIDLCPDTLNGRAIPTDVRDLMHATGVRRDDLYLTRDIESLNDPLVASNTYWYPWTLPGVSSMLGALYTTHDAKAVIAFGEVYGSVIQSLGYGIDGQHLGFRLFDICIDGKFLDHDAMVKVCAEFGVEMVPVLYRGPFSLAKVKEVSGGNTTLGAKHIREGTVVRPVVERTHPLVGRLVMKYISDQYLFSDASDSKDV